MSPRVFALLPLEDVLPGLGRPWLSVGRSLSLVGQHVLIVQRSPLVGLPLLLTACQRYDAIDVPRRKVWSPVDQLTALLSQSTRRLLLWLVKTQTELISD